ncbi:FadR/GntR family transcriptional regulator [Actinomadura sp. CNU-125]|uniref:FadR/GntR family transcriptional regulator n=1 Tax=Actinomadura sp. CNU-125 TaxID=1904961 RepID=UPI0021CC7E64|nr:FCD domain-containing protein [Actinomadura sp. CNU-125]
MGRSTVRERCARSPARLVQARQGAGVFVLATEPDEDWRTRLRRASVVDVYEIREMVEGRATELAALRRTDDDLAAIDRALAARTAALPADGAAGRRVEAFIDADIALHAAIVRAAHNPILVDLFAEFVPVLREGLLEVTSLMDVRRHDLDHGRDAHAALVEAVRDRDPSAAARIIAAELEQTLDGLRNR